MRKRGWNSSVFLTVQLVLQLHCYKMAGIKTQTSLLLCHVQPPSLLRSEQRTTGSFCLSVAFTRSFKTFDVAKTHCKPIFSADVQFYERFSRVFVWMLWLNKQEMCKKSLKTWFDANDPTTIPFKQQTTQCILRNNYVTFITEFYMDNYYQSQHWKRFQFYVIFHEWTTHFIADST